MQSYTRALRHVRRDTANTIASSLIGARLDYCNALLYGTSASNIAKLYRLYIGSRTLLLE